MYWILFIAVALASFLVQRNLQAKFDKYSRVPTGGGLTGGEIAEQMLHQNGIFDVAVTCIEGTLTDHFDPTRKTVNLSRDVFYGRNITAAAVAAHECGHAVQHAVGYKPVELRSKMVPAVQFASQWVQWVLLGGILLVNVFPQLLMLGIALFALTTIFSFVTLPVEVDASRRAINWLAQSGILTRQTAEPATEALRAAAYTYVVAALSSLGTLVYYVSILTNRR